MSTRTTIILIAIAAVVCGVGIAVGIEWLRNSAGGLIAVVSGVSAMKRQKRSGRRRSVEEHRRAEARRKALEAASERRSAGKSTSEAAEAWNTREER